jgi:peptidoglycan-N-acetylmuramic acid deacetylase
MIDEGHTLGNHSTKHRNFPDMPLEEAAEDLMTLHDYVLANYGYKMWLFRPPEGSFCEQTLGLAQSLGYQTVLWSFAYRDWEPENQMIAIEAVDRILSTAHPGEICLLHAVSRTNAEILGEVIDTLRQRNFEFADYFGFQ